MPVNPGNRYPDPTVADKVTAVIQRNSTVAAFLAGQASAALLFLAVLLVLVVTH